MYDKGDLRGKGIIYFERVRNFKEGAVNIGRCYRAVKLDKDYKRC